MNRLRKFLAARDGVAFIEMAFVTPFLILLFIGGFELVRYLVILQKVEKATYALANIASQYAPATYAQADGELDEDEVRLNIFPQLERIMDPYDRREYTAILTSIRKEDVNVVVKWQMGGGGSLAGAFSIANNAAPSDPPDSRVRNGATSFNSELGAALSTMLENENMVVSEVFYRYQPIMQGTLQSLGLAIQPVDVHRWLFVKPRDADLVCLPPTFYYGECLPSGTPSGPGRACYSATVTSNHAECGIYYRANGTTQKDMEPCDYNGRNPPSGWAWCG